MGSRLFSHTFLKVEIWYSLKDRYSSRYLTRFPVCALASSKREPTPCFLNLNNFLEKLKVKTFEVRQVRSRQYPTLYLRHKNYPWLTKHKCHSVKNDVRQY